VPVVSSWLAIASATAAFQSPPEPDPGERILNAACTTCHDLGPIQRDALDKRGWSDMVERMIQRGADVASDQDEATLVDYLVAHFGPLPAGPGKDILLNTCTACHDLQRVKQEGGTREQWQDVLGTMLNEGAMLSDQDFPVLLEYLAKNFGPK
jgi:cytochrome c5